MPNEQTPDPDWIDRLQERSQTRNEQIEELVQQYRKQGIDLPPLEQIPDMLEELNQLQMMFRSHSLRLTRLYARLYLIQEKNQMRLEQESKQHEQQSQ